MVHLRYDVIAPDRAFHAALIDAASARTVSRLHDHDFFEVFLVLGGSGLHLVGDRGLAISTGSLTLIRPSDAHAFDGRLGLTWANVAFPMDRWRAFEALTGLGELATENAPPTRQLEGEEFSAVRSAFLRTIHRYQEGGRGLDLAELLAVALGALTRRPSTAPEPDDWLGRATSAMRDPINLAGGLRRFEEIAGVSLPHLCRTMRKRTGRSPTDFVNELRMRRAATLLATSDRTVADVADSVGMESVGYFHRLFKAQFGTTPGEFRRREAGRVI